MMSLHYATCKISLICKISTFFEYLGFVNPRSDLKTKICKHMSTVSKNVYISKLDVIVDKHINTCCKIIKMKLADVKAGILTKVLSIMTNIRNLKLVIMREYQNTKYSFCKRIHTKLVWASLCDEENNNNNNKKNKTLPWPYVISDLNGEETVGTFNEEELPKTSKKNLGLKK